MTSSIRPDIVCFGDSLTVGYQTPALDMPTYHETLYGKFLERRLGRNRRVLISGLCGELTAEMMQRFHRDVIAHQPTYVVVLGGTNDLGSNIAPSEIMRNLSGMYVQGLEAKVQPIAVTVPSIRIPGLCDSSIDPKSQSDRKVQNELVHCYIEPRLELNQMIRDYGLKMGVSCLDLFSATVEGEHNVLAAPFSNDGLHLSTRGYELFATLLWDQVFRVKYGNS